MLRLGGVAGLNQESLTPQARAYLKRLVAWAEGYEDAKQARRAAYWTEERRLAHGRKAAEAWTSKSRPKVKQRPPGDRVVPDLPDDTLVWRSTNQRTVYHLTNDCPSIGPNANLNRGKLGAAKASGRVLCSTESFHWKHRGA